MCSTFSSLAWSIALVCFAVLMAPANFYAQELIQRRPYPGERFDRWAYEFDDDDDGYWPDDYFGLFGREPGIHGEDAIFGDVPSRTSLWSSERADGVLPSKSARRSGNISTDPYTYRYEFD